MRASVFTKFDPVSAKQHPGPSWQSFDPDGVGNHDAVIRPFACKKRVNRSPVGMKAITDDLSVNIMKTQRGAYNAGISVMKRGHAVIHMGHTSRAICKSHHRLLTGCRGMAQRRHDAVFIQVSGQPVSLIPFTCKCHDPDHAVRGVKIPPELFKVRNSTIFPRVCAFEGAVHIWPLQVNAEYLSTGTLDLMYLAVRLAVCELALPDGEPCPLIIDDALVNLDETRFKQAMELLKEIAKERQVILFTCRQ